MIEHEITTLEAKIKKMDNTSELSESVVITVNKNILKELNIMKHFIKDNYPKLKTFYQ